MAAAAAEEIISGMRMGQTDGRPSRNEPTSLFSVDCLARFLHDVDDADYEEDGPRWLLARD